MSRGAAAAVLSGSLLVVGCNLFVPLDDLSDGSAAGSSAVASSSSGGGGGQGASSSSGAGADGGSTSSGAGGEGGRGGTGGSGASGGGGSGAGAAPPTCTGIHGPTEVVVAALGACMDSTEVTFGQYAEFLPSAPDPASLPAECAWKTTFVPASMGAPNRPVADVDWCDAYAYCAWAGKRLCGKIGGGSLTLAEAKDPGVGEWMTACTAAGTKIYPYGDLYQQATCNGDGAAATSTDVATFPGCVGGYPGLFDLSGNIAEWEDSCDTANPDPAAQLCGSRGGDYGESANNLACQFAELRGRAGRFPWIGFRCCSG